MSVWQRLTDRQPHWLAGVVVLILLAGMLIGHHKTRKPLFTVTVPVLLLAQGAGLYLLFGH